MNNEGCHHHVLFYCPTSTDSWHIVLDQDIEYDIKVVRTLGRFWDECLLFVNGQERDCNLKWHPCTPFCYSDGMFNWEENGQSFLLVLRGPFLLQPCGKLYLFVDGYEAYSNVEFGAFWRKRGNRIFMIGATFLMIASLLAFLTMTISDGYLHFDEMFLIHIPFLAVGFSYVIAGLSTMIRFRKTESSWRTYYNPKWSLEVKFI